MSEQFLAKRAWRPLTDAGLRQAIEQRVRASTELLRDAADVKERALQEGERNPQPYMTSWTDLSLGAGYPGLCLLFGELDRVEPEAGWDLVGHQMLVAVQQAVTQSGIATYDLWGGLAGIQMGIRALSRGGTRYGGMMASFSSFAAAQLPGVIEAKTRRLLDGELQMTDFDLMGGMTGIGRYLLAFRDQPTLQGVLNYLIRLSGEKEVDGQDVPLWHITAANQFLAADREQYPLGDFNLGLSHGIAGPMGLLALAKLQGVEIAGQEAAIRRYAEWLCAWTLEDEAGVYWPGRLPLEVYLTGWGDRERTPSHDSWCYGAVGIARQLWFAGEALGEAGWKELAVQAALATFRRLREKQGRFAPNFCHGLAGLVHGAQVMYAETGIETFAEERDRLVKQVLELYDEALAFGVYELRQGQKWSRPGLLEGLAGTLIVLTSLQAEEAPEWDAVFLMS
jgi:hypothetical protein